MKARQYNKENISKLFLSPYVDSIIEGDAIAFHNDLFRQVVITPPLVTGAEQFLDKLREGMEVEEMIDYLSASLQTENAEDVLEGLMQKGILE